MVKIVKLHNNVEIIGNINMTSGEKIVVDDPFSINYMLSPRSDRPIVGLLRYMPFADKHKVEIKMSDVLHVADARSSMCSYYTAVLANHVNDIDQTIDRELDHIAELELNSQKVEEPADILSVMLERINPNNNIH